MKFLTICEEWIRRLFLCTLGVGLLVLPGFYVYQILTTFQFHTGIGFGLFVLNILIAVYVFSMMLSAPMQWLSGVIHRRPGRFFLALFVPYVWFLYLGLGILVAFMYNHKVQGALMYELHEHTLTGGFVVSAVYVLWHFSVLVLAIKRVISWKRSREYPNV